MNSFAAMWLAEPGSIPAVDTINWPTQVLCNEYGSLAQLTAFETISWPKHTSYTISRATLSSAMNSTTGFNPMPPWDTTANATESCHGQAETMQSIHPHQRHGLPLIN
jgi:hypothetical protein